VRAIAIFLVYPEADRGDIRKPFSTTDTSILRSTPIDDASAQQVRAVFDSGKRIQ